ncbi:MAG: class I SAM-dependent methyltransferase, partial [Caldilineaceae bacterium]
SAQAERIRAAGEAAGLPIHYFKRSRTLPRVEWALGLLRGMRPGSLLDIGSGRGTFLWPLLDAFPHLPVTAVDADSRRAELLAAAQAGGMERLTARLADATSLPFDDRSFDVVTFLEVLEHIPDAERALAEGVRVCERALLITVPSRPDDNPEHIHLFDEDRLRQMLAACGVSRVKCAGVSGHLTILAQK